MAGLVNQYQQGAFTTPVNGTVADATVVLSNDNATRGKHNSHDSDATIHVQSSTLANRPGASVAQRLWITTDGLRAYLDTGSAWNEIAYLSLAAGGTVSGPVVLGSTLNVSGTSTLAAVTATTGTFSGLIASTVGNNLDTFTNVGNATTGFIRIRLANTGGQLKLGVENSTGNTNFTNSNAYAALIWTDLATGIDFGTNNTRRGGFSATGAFDLTNGLTVSANGITVNSGTSAFQAASFVGSLTVPAAAATASFIGPFGANGVSVLNNTATTLFAATTYLNFSDCILVTGGDNVNASFATVLTRCGNGPITLNTLSSQGCTLAMSGNNLQVTQTSGSTQTYTARVYRFAGA